MIENLKNALAKHDIEFEQITEELISVENFLTEAELDFFWETINAAKQEDWEVEYTANLARFCMEKFGRDDVDNLVAEGKFEITQNWNDKNLNIVHSPEYRVIHNRLSSLISESDKGLKLSGMATIQRMQPGVELKSHTDDHTDPSIHFATIAYINDDYKDGELFFKKLDLKVRPKPGTLLIFPGNESYEHGVETVSEGPIRYVLVGFVKEANHYDNNKY